MSTSTTSVVHTTGEIRTCHGTTVDTSCATCGGPGTVYTPTATDLALLARWDAQQELLTRWVDVLPEGTRIGTLNQRQGEVALTPPLLVCHATPQPPAPHGVRWRTWMSWAPDMRTRVGRQLADEVTALEQQHPRPLVGAA